jgi:predicted ATPase/class 3 adenylate cyclase
MSALPTGTVTYLFTDIEASTQRWERQRAAMEQAFARHEEIMRAAMEQHGGYVYKMIGDAFQVAFSTAPAALAAAVSAQRALFREPWGESKPVKVRMALHTGETEERGDDYVGPLLNRVARLMSAAHGGQILMTQATYELVRDAQPEGVTLRDMGEHRLKDIERPERIYQLVAEDLPQDFPPLKTLDAHPNNLPLKLTSFVGRRAELAEVRKLLDSTRLLTLTGPGGVGKTRLALQTAVLSLDEYKNGVYFVPLASVSSTENALHSIADTLRFNIGSHSVFVDFKKQLLEYLRDQSMLMVMDNFEHLVESAGLVTDLLENTTDLKIMVTSRERLNLQGEWIYNVEGMDFPENGHPDGNGEYSAVELFLERAQQVEPHLALSEENHSSINQICRMVAGMPLAIELAAGWAFALSPHEIVKEIERNIDFLVTTRRDIPDKHRSIRAVFNQSWELLTADQQVVLQRLSVFRGGFDRAAAMKVAGADLLELSDFVNKSLVRRSAEGRYEIHELLRQYAQEKLVVHPEDEDQVRQRHARYYAEFLSQRTEHVFGDSLVEIREEIRSDIDNIRMAIDWAVKHWQSDEARAFLEDYYAYYMVQGWHEGAEALGRIANLVNDARQVDEARPKPVNAVYLSARVYHANFESHLGHHAESDTICLEYLTVMREIGLQPELAICLQSLGINVFYRGNFDTSIDYLTESIQKSRAFRKQWITGISLLYLGWAYDELGNCDQAETLYLESYHIFEKEGNLWAKALAISKLGLVASSRKDFQLARRYEEESLDLFAKFGDLSGEAYTNSRLSVVAYHEGNYTEAVRYGLIGLDRFKELNHSWGVPLSHCRIGFPTLAMGDLREAENHFFKALSLVARSQSTLHTLYALGGIASVWVVDGKYQQAAEIFGLFLHHPQTPAEHKELTEPWHADLDKKLPAQDYKAAFERGKNGDLDQIVENLLRERTPLSIR